MEHQKIGELIIEKNNQFIVFNKPPGIGVQPDKSGDKSLLDLAEIYSKSKLGLVHRIDRPASGLVLFSKSKGALATLNVQFQNREVEKIYLVVVKNKPAENTGQLLHHIRKDSRNNRSKAYNVAGKGTKEAIMHYEVIASIDNYHLLRVILKTGRYHQIRAQLAHIKCPVKGDTKYGFKRGNENHSIHLHAYKLAFKHPITSEKCQFKAAVPNNDPVWKAFSEILPELAQ